jgi:hypothetical protein
MNEVTECCRHTPVYYILTNPDGSLFYEPWDFCPECLECCSLTTEEKARQRDKLKAILPSSEELNIIIKNAINRIKEPKE